MSQLHPPTLDELRENLLGKVVIVTGAAQGIGFAIAEMFSMSGADVVIADFNEELGRKAAESIIHGATFIKCNVTSWTEQVRLFQDTVSRYGRVDLVVCNAGIDPEIFLARPLNKHELASATSQVRYNFLADEYMEGDASSLRPPPNTIMDVNVTGVIYNLKLAIHYMRQMGGGKIVVIGSAAGYVPVPNQSMYTASKHAVVGLVRSVSRKAECVEKGIAVAMVAPWLTLTPMTSDLEVEITEERLASSAKDVASAVSIIATQSVESINGKSIWVQGQTYTEVEKSMSDFVTNFIL